MIGLRRNACAARSTERRRLSFRADSPRWDQGHVMLASSRVSTILPVQAKRAEAIMPVDAIPLLEDLGSLSSLTKPALAEIAKLGRFRDFAPGERIIEKEGFHKITRETPSLARFLTQILADRLTEGGFMASKTIGKYQLLGELGRGGMSVVYNAVHTSLNRPVAVKMLNHELAFDERFRASFQQEARVIAGLSHENIVQVYDTEQAYATYFIMMEFIAGTSLAKLIEASGRFPGSQARDILIQMCRALGFAHDRGIVHRDVKPSNVIMTPDGRVKLMDFGLAQVQATEAKPDDEEVVGTVEYMSPEQIRGP